MGYTFLVTVKQFFKWTIVFNFKKMEVEMHISFMIFSEKNNTLSNNV